MKSIKNNSIYKLIIKNSVFIAKSYRVYTIEEVNNYLNQEKLEYKDATHICYAYIIDSNMKCSDDKEPSGTAGTPMLEVLKKNNLNYTLCIVIRYFGKIKLGASNLLRAYSNSCKEVIKLSEIIELRNCINADIYFDYSIKKTIDSILNKEIIVSYNYKEIIHYNIIISENILDKIQNIKNVKIENIKQIYV